LGPYTGSSPIHTHKSSQKVEGLGFTRKKREEMEGDKRISFVGPKEKECLTLAHQ